MAGPTSLSFVAKLLDKPPIIPADLRTAHEPPDHAQPDISTYSADATDIPPPSGMASLSLSTAQDDDPYFMFGSGFLTSASKIGKMEREQAEIEELLSLRSGAQDKIKGLGLLRHMIAHVEKQMNRSASAPVQSTGTIRFQAAQPRVSSTGRDMLVFSCQVLQNLMGQDDKALILAEKTESWLPRAALLFGRALGTLYRASPEHDTSLADTIYTTSVTELLKQIQGNQHGLRCDQCSSTRGHPLSITQLKLLLVLNIHLAFWNNSKQFAENLLVDIIWPIQVSLFSCQARIRQSANKILVRAIKAHKGGDTKAAKGIEILAVTSYDSAEDGLRQVVQGAISHEDLSLFLQTLVEIWEESPLSLRYKLNSVRRQYFDTRSLWQSVKPAIQQNEFDSHAVKSCCELLPLMACGDPVTFASLCLQEAVAFLINSRLPHLETRLWSLGSTIKAVGGDAFPVRQRAFQFLRNNLQAKEEPDECWRAATALLLTFGPCVSEEVVQILQIARGSDITLPFLEFVTGVSTYVQIASRLVEEMITDELTERIECGPLKKDLTEWLALVRLMPCYCLQASDTMKQLVTELFRLAVSPSAPPTLVLAALDQVIHPSLCSDEASAILVDAMLNLIQDCEDAEILELCLKRLSHPALRFEMKSVTLPLLLQLGASTHRLQRIVASLLTLQASRFPSLIIPVLRGFIRTTLMQVDVEIRNETPAAIQLLATCCLVLPSLTVALSEMYSRPILTILLDRLAEATSVNKDTEIVISSITNVAKQCTHVWDSPKLERAVTEVKRLLGTRTTAKEAVLGLSCLASLMAIPESAKLQNSVMTEMFVDYLFDDKDLEIVVKRKAMAVVGVIGTADRNPIKARDHTAAFLRECSTYNASTTGRITTAITRDKRGAQSADYQLSMICNNLVTLLEQRSFPGKLPIWTAIMKLVVMVPEERLTDLLPDVLEDIVTEYEYNATTTFGTSQRSRILTLISQGIMLKPKGFEKVWPRLRTRLASVAQEDHLKAADILGCLLVILSVISYRRGDVKTITPELLPVLLSLLRISGVESGTIVFAIKLLGVFQSHTSAYICPIATTLANIEDESEDVHIEILRLLAHLSDYVSLFAATLIVRGILSRPNFVRLKSEEAEICRERIRASLEFCPILPQMFTFSDYPDLRPYQDIQFSNLAIRDSDRADHPFSSQVWDLSDLKDRTDWHTWSSRLERNIVDASHINLTKVAASLTPRVPRGISHASFIAYYDSLNGQEKECVHRAIGELLVRTDTPEYIRSLWLSILEFSQKSNIGRLPTELLRAARRSLMVQRHRLSERGDPLLVWYAEIDAAEDLNSSSLSALIEANLRVGVGSNVRQDDAALSAMQLAESEGLTLDPSWLEALGRWEIAIDLNKRHQAGTPFKSVSTALTCYHALTDFSAVLDLAKEYFPLLPQHERAQVGHWCTVAAWAEGDFEAMATYLSSQNKGSTKLLYKAILETHRGEYPKALKHISKGQAAVFDELQVKSGYHDFSTENYTSAIKTLAKGQMLVELEEVIRYKQSDHRPELQRFMSDTWQSRLKLSHANVNTFYKRLLLWSLAAPLHQLQDGWLYLAKIAHEKGLKSGRRILSMIGTDSQPGDKVAYTRLRFDWMDATNRAQKQRLLQELESHVLLLSKVCGFPEGTICQPETWTFPQKEIAHAGSRLHRHRLARSLARLAQWTREFQGEAWIRDSSERAYEYVGTSAMLDPEWPEATGLMAEMAIDLLEHKQAGARGELTEGMVDRYVLPACYVLFQSIKLRTSAEQSIKATLLALMQWFKHGSNPRVLEFVKEEMRTTPTVAWLPTITQLIARLGAKDVQLRESLVKFLLRMAEDYADALIWPLLTASQTPRSVHQGAARSIMKRMTAIPKYSKMVEQAEIFGLDLIRSAMSPAEKWKNRIEQLLYHDGLTPASWVEFVEGYDGLITPQSEEEYLFIQRFGDSLLSAKAEVERYFNGAKAAFYKACAEYQNVYRKICTLLDSWRKPGFQLNLRLTAPRISNIEESQVLVPGQFDANKSRHEQCFIDRFEPMLDVINTKQLPRKLVMFAKTGRFDFLLKGNEDLRQDERIMQLITLTNTLLNHDNEAFTRRLFLETYNVIPLSPDSGLCQWVPNTETLMNLVKTSREKSKVTQRLGDKELAAMFNVDHKELSRGGFDMDKAMQTYDTLPVAEKAQRYKNVLALSHHTDLKDLLWRRSSSSQTWLSRRTCFSRSIATASMVGYLVGLGDRHPGNLLIEQTKFNAIIIDFGDVFEAAAERNMYPERVPFRLTPEIFNTFEFAATHGVKAPGSRGHFKQSSVITVNILRKHKETLLAMLEAFALDPLLTWEAKELSVTNNRPATDKRAKLDQANSQPKVEEVRQRQQQRQETEVVVNLGGSFIAAGSLADKVDDRLKSGHASAERTSGTDIHIDLGARDITQRLEQTRLQTVKEESLDTTTTREGEDSYLAKQMEYVMTNERAFKVLDRIEKKLSGNDVEGAAAQCGENQVQRLIEEATSHDNLAQGYALGWLPAW